MPDPGWTNSNKSAIVGDSIQAEVSPEDQWLTNDPRLELLELCQILPAQKNVYVKVLFVASEIGRLSRLFELR